MLSFMQITKSSYVSFSYWLSVRWNKNYVRICMNIKVKEKLIVVIKLRKRQIDYKFWKQKQYLKKKNNKTQ